ncbi:MAG TPA: hypothetical protein VHX90_07650 [Verrucomicrobiae bacterium]|jgi:hypothetical protein|nr:hypothetical protein [Verrucomicrobiae bacterium]
MKIKIENSVTVGGKVHKKGATPDLDPKIAKQLIAGNFATEYVAPEKNPNGASSASPQRSVEAIKADMRAYYTTFTTEQLEAVKLEIAALPDNDPNRANATLVLEVIAELEKK